MKASIILLALLPTLWLPSDLAAQAHAHSASTAPAAASDSAAVLGVVQRFFDAMAARDTAAWGEVMTHDGQWYGYTENADGFSMFRRTNREAIDGLAVSSDTIVERMWDPTVLLHDRMAVVWTPYDLYINGKFSHCGVDAFTLLKTNAGWQIGSIVFSREPTGCAPSPLGPLQSGTR